MSLDPERIGRINDNVLYESLGIRIEEAGPGPDSPGFARTRMRAPRSLRWPSADQPHGGIVATQLDTTMATAVMATLEPGELCTTVSLEVQYVGPASGDALVCRAWCLHRTGRTGFVRAETTAPEGRLVAMGQASFRILRGEPPGAESRETTPGARRPSP